MKIVLQLISSLMGAAGFALLYNVKGKKLFFSSLGGLIVWAVYLASTTYLCFTEIEGYIVSAMFAGLYSEVFARIEKCPASVFLLIAIIPLIPGRSLFETIHYIINGNYSLFLSTGIHTLGLAGSIAIGIIIILPVCRIFFSVKTNNYNSEGHDLYENHHSH